MVPSNLWSGSLASSGEPATGPAKLLAHTQSTSQPFSRCKLFAHCCAGLAELGMAACIQHCSAGTLVLDESRMCRFGICELDSQLASCNILGWHANIT